MLAAINNRPDIINALIEAGADDLTDRDGRTALMLASREGKPEAVNALIDAGAYVKVKDLYGETAVYYLRNITKIKKTDSLKRTLKRLEELSK